jgi:ParB-like chromosome segregation protein Spo0J
VAEAISVAGYRILRRLVKGEVDPAFDALPEAERLAITRRLLTKYEAELADLDHKIAYLEARPAGSAAQRAQHATRIDELRAQHRRVTVRAAGIRELIAQEKGAG